MPLHPVADYLDLNHTPFPRLFEGIQEVWEVLPRIGPFLKEWLEPSVEGDLDGDIHIQGPVFVGPGVRIMVSSGSAIAAVSGTVSKDRTEMSPGMS